MRRPIWIALFVAVSLVWFGAVIGHSFIATPAKFAATSLTRPVAFDVGRATFAVFSIVEWVLCALLVIAAAAASLKHWRSIALASIVALVAIVALQGFWLLPGLNARAAAVIAGSPLPPSMHHAAYATLELSKMALLALVAGTGFRHLVQTRD